MSAHVLIIEDDDGLRDLLIEEVAEMGHVVRGAGSVEEAKRALAEAAPDVVVTDVRLPGTSGLDLLRHVAAVPDAPAVIVITAFGTIRQAVEALKLGAEDFLTKPLDLDHLRISVERALERRELRRRVGRYREALGPHGFHGLVGQSEPMRRLGDEVRLIARADGPVLITGESGTGKELVARAVHAESSRADGPFVPVNCAGVPAELLESEFFGHEKGAFTGARSSHRGLFVDASGGTLLLDEIGEMPVALQAKLLRVLQEGRVRPVGSTAEVEVDVRVLASTNRDLEAEMRAGRFREDLYYRLETFRLRVPPLRARGDDVELLAAFFAERHAVRHDRPGLELSAEVLEALRRYPFPGNVRELANAIERAVAFATEGAVEVQHLPARLREAAPGTASSPAPSWMPEADELPPLAEVERRYIRHVLDAAEGNKRQAARLLGIARRTLYRKLDEIEDTPPRP